MEGFEVVGGENGGLLSGRRISVANPELDGDGSFGLLNPSDPLPMPLVPGQLTPPNETAPIAPQQNLWSSFAPEQTPGGDGLSARPANEAAFLDADGKAPVRLDDGTWDQLDRVGSWMARNKQHGRGSVSERGSEHVIDLLSGWNRSGGDPNDKVSQRVGA
mmetsp:Transcript_46644/g.130071  ORF Transcript_46644/g.130071 Transcript_46644/m.130071 type:complete len:161 (+) Transcript_46644:560-1042(+)